MAMSQKEIDDILTGFGETRSVPLEQRLAAAKAMQNLSKDDMVFLRGDQLVKLIKDVRIPEVSELKGRIGFGALIDHANLLAEIAAQNKIWPGR